MAVRKSSLDKIDVVILTKDSEWMLEKCLDSIYQNVPVNRLIAVDGLSTDNTLSILHNYGKKYRNVKILADKGTRATARQKGIESIETEWFMFVDSDVVLCK
ncbi:MAG: glycosyltransferase family A protein, partial [Candidatus Aenigmarchaeota archaeon]|nr:glycosyltransferase family A protein [Candidatus Aenigmarchaeota archaeon]